MYPESETINKTHKSRAQRWLWRAALAAVLPALIAGATLAQAAEMSRVAVADGVELAVKVDGKGPVPVVFIHGYSMSMAVWEKVVGQFPASRYTTYTYDLRGFGDSSKPETGYKQSQHAQDLLALMDRLALRRAVIVGHSLGATIGQEFAVRFPQRVLALVTADGNARNQPPRGADEAIRQRANAYGTREQNAKVLEATIPRYFDPRNADPADIRRFVDIALKASTTALREQLIDVYAAPQLDPEAYRSMRFPVLAIHGALDPFSPIANAVAISDIVPEGEVALVARTGHSPMWERPEAWARAVLDFLERRLPATR